MLVCILHLLPASWTSQWTKIAILEPESSPLSGPAQPILNQDPVNIVCKDIISKLELKNLLLYSKWHNWLQEDRANGLYFEY